MTQPSERRPSLVGDAEIFGWATLGAGSLTVLLLALKNTWEPDQHASSFALPFWPWVLLFYARWCGAALVVTHLMGRALRRRSLPGRLAGLASVVFAAGAVFTNSRALRIVASADGPDRLRWAGGCALLLLTLGLASLALPRHRWLHRSLGAAGLVACAVAFVPAPAAPLRAEALRAEAPQAQRLGSQRVLLFGLDGADWKYVEPLMARGDLPHLAGLRDRGISGSLATIRPGYSPVIWTTVATGQPPEKHGVRAFVATRFRGVDAPLPELRPVHWVGYQRLVDWLWRVGAIYESPIMSYLRRAPAIWNLCTASGRPLSVVNWWATWPAEPTLGYMVSQQINYWFYSERDVHALRGSVTYPRSLHGELVDLVVRPAEVSYEDARRFLDVPREEYENTPPFMRPLNVVSHFKSAFAIYETDRRIASYLIGRGAERFGHAPDLMMITRIVDMASHAALRYSELTTEHPEATEEEERCFGRFVTQAYREADVLLGEVIEAFGPGNVIVLSDHGFELVSGRPGGRDRYEHDHGPPGVFIAAGPAFRPGKVEGLSVYDVLPLLAYLQEIPISDELPGKLRRDILAPEVLEILPEHRVASYADVTPAHTAEIPSVVRDRQLDELRALGYIE